MPDRKNWMKSIPDETFLSDIAIPGTHDTCALHGGPPAECQRQNLREQLEDGIRFIDIRCRHEDDSFPIYHGPISQKIDFERVLAICEDFLRSYRSECIVMSIKNEEGDIPIVSGIKDTISDLIEPDKNKKKFGAIFEEEYLPRVKYTVWPYNDKPEPEGTLKYDGGTLKTPQLKDVRGKIVIVSRHKEIRGIPWPDVNSSSELTVQDEYQIKVNLDPRKQGTGGTDKKIQDVKKYIDDSIKANDGWYINFLSATGLETNANAVANLLKADLFPRSIATDVNPAIEEYINQVKLKKVKEFSQVGERVTVKRDPVRLGTLVMDFPSEELIDTIIKANHESENISLDTWRKRG